MSLHGWIGDAYNPLFWGKALSLVLRMWGVMSGLFLLISTYRFMDG